MLGSPVGSCLPTTAIPTGSLPYAPDWVDVQRMLADVDTDKPRDIRDRAILLLLAIYGMRSGEVAALRGPHMAFPGLSMVDFWTRTWTRTRP